MVEMGYVLGELGQFDEAITRLTEGHARLRRTLGERHGGVAEAKANLGTTLFRQGNFAEAERLYIQSLLVWEELLGRSHPQTLVGLLLSSVATAAWEE